MTTCQEKPAKWSHMASDSLGAVLRREEDRANYKKWTWAQQLLNENPDTAVEITKILGISHTLLKKHTDALKSFSKLQQLKKLQDQEHFLPMRHIIAIHNAMMKVESPTPELWEILDEELLAFFTPSENEQSLPVRSTVTRKINRILSSLGIILKPDRSKELPRRQRGYTFTQSGSGRARVELETDEATGRQIDEAISVLANQLELTKEEAFSHLFLQGLRNKTAADPNFWQQTNVPSKRRGGSRKKKSQKARRRSRR